jgi:hypothetical protein
MIILDINVVSQPSNQKAKPWCGRVIDPGEINR